jgi:hypothetical protein
MLIASLIRWASRTYLETLESPETLIKRLPATDHTSARFLCGEDWLLHGVAPSSLDFDKYAVVHYTGVRKGARGRMNTYHDRYLPEYYRCPPSPGSRRPEAPGKPWWMPATYRQPDGFSAAAAAMDPPALTPCVDVTYICHGDGCAPLARYYPMFLALAAALALPVHRVWRRITAAG